GGAGGMAGSSARGGAGGTGGAIRLGNGSPCAASADCNSAICVDGVCCATACSGACFSCSLPGAVGTCVVVPAGAMDPHGACPTMSPATCGSNGRCNGSGACQTYGPETVCASETCSDGAYSPPRMCSVIGGCLAPQQFLCLPYKCDGNRCATFCTADPDCAPDYHCLNGSCRREPEWTCTSNDECASGFCQQGVCCATACAGPCNSCRLSGTIGTCRPVPSPDPTWNCPGA
ncbi:MAG TPA: hypothetical protein VN903_38595, partial [Polyangia bacterium]|nr:hypothetical protein [Polyangia bacterium]